MKSRQNCFRRRSKKIVRADAGSFTRRLFPFVSGRRHEQSGVGVGAPKLIRGPPNLGGQYQSSRKTCQEGIVEKSQNVRGISQRVSICSGLVAKWPQREFCPEMNLADSRFDRMHLAFLCEHPM